MGTWRSRSFLGRSALAAPMVFPTVGGPPAPGEAGLAGRGEERRERGFVFDLEARRTRLADADLLAGLARFVAAHCEPYTTRKFDAWPERPCAALTLIQRFGSFRHALARIGVMGGKVAEYSAADLMALLEAVWIRIGRPPGSTMLARHARISAQPYENRWGSLRKACEALAKYHGGKISRRRLLNPVGWRARAQVPVSVRWKVLRRDGHRCCLCGASAREDPKVKLHIDHIRPVSRGGMAEESNLRTLCAACNQGKSDEPARGRRGRRGETVSR